MPKPRLEALLKEIRACEVCKAELPFPPRPVLQAGARARILVVGQAPGRLAHTSGLPFDDPSGDRLRDWMGIDREPFYDPERIAIVPMGFCFPGSLARGDSPPRPECAPLWRERLLEELPRIRLTIVLGRYAIQWHLGEKRPLGRLLAEWRDWPEEILALPHPSPRNHRWLADHPFVEGEIVPELRRRVAALLRDDRG